MADDFIFVRHQSGTRVTKSEMLSWDWWNSDGPSAIMRDFRVIYENDEIGVEHSFVTFSDGNTQAVMAVFKFKDGQIISFETGATNMPK